MLDGEDAENADIVVTFEGSYDTPGENPYTSWTQAAWELDYPANDFAALIHSHPTAPRRRSLFGMRLAGAAEHRLRVRRDELRGAPVLLQRPLDGSAQQQLLRPGRTACRRCATAGDPTDRPPRSTSQTAANRRRFDDRPALRRFIQPSAHPAGRGHPRQGDDLRMGLDNPITSLPSHPAPARVRSQATAEMGRSLGTGMRGFKESLTGEGVQPALTAEQQLPATVAGGTQAGAPLAAAVPHPSLRQCTTTRCRRPDGPQPGRRVESLNDGCRRTLHRSRRPTQRRRPSRGAFAGG